MFVLLIILLSFVVNVQAQDMCGNHPNPEQIQQLFKYRGDLKKTTFAASKINEELITIPLKVHIVADSAGNYQYNLQTFLSQVCELNNLYREVGFYFYMLPEVNYVYNNRYTTSSSKLEEPEEVLYELLHNHYHYGAINVYYTRGTGICGMAPFPSWAMFFGGKTGVLMDGQDRCASEGKKTLAHELGHHFDLWHTFQGWDEGSPLTSEYVTREPEYKNCETAGDGFCDTPADILDYSCPYRGTVVDLRGERYAPDVSLIMSYHGDACQTKFSSQQIAHMREVVYGDTSRRIYLRNQVTDFSAANATSILSPADNQQVSYGRPTQFSWTEVENSEGYLFSITTGAGIVIEQKIVSTNTATYTFTAADRSRQLLYWTVTPLRFTQLCANTTTRRRVRIVDPGTNVFNHEAISFSVYPNPALGGKNLTLQFDERSIREMKDKMLVKISSLNGQTVQEVIFDRISEKIDIRLNENISSGVYFIYFQSGDVVYQSKLMIQ